MSPKLYGSLWVLYFASAVILLVGGFFTLTTLIVYGLVAFGLVFAGMMCLLPNVVSHSVHEGEGKPRIAAHTAAAPLPLRVPAGQTHFPVGLRTN